MKAEWLGIDIKTGRHDRRLARAEEMFIGILWPEHIGLHRAMAAEEVAVRFARRFGAEYLSRMTHPRRLERWKRDVRIMQNHLLQYHDGVPVLSKAGTDGGYWIAENEGEAAAFYDTFRRRGLTGLVKASRGKASAMADMVQQLAFEFEDLLDATEQVPIERPRSGMTAPVQIVDRMLERMTREPEKFAGALRKIGEKYGSILLPRERLAAVQSRVRELDALIQGMTAVE